MLVFRLFALFFLHLVLEQEVIGTCRHGGIFTFNEINPNGKQSGGLSEVNEFIELILPEVCKCVDAILMSRSFTIKFVNVNPSWR